MKVESVDDDTLYSHKRLKVGSKSVETPTKALQVNKTTRKDSVLDEARGVNEIYFEVSPNSLESGRRERKPYFKKTIGQSLNKANRDEINILFPQFRSTDSFSRENLLYLADTVYSTGDFVTVPLMSDLLKAIRDQDSSGLGSPYFQIYKENVKKFVEAVQQINGKPIMGTIPALPWDFTNDLVRFYIDKGVKAFCFDFDGRQITAETQLSDMVTPLMRQIATENLEEDVFLYALNAHKGRKTQNNITPARDFFSHGFGFDVLGDKHVSPDLPPHIYQQMADEDPELYLFDRDDYVYNSLSYGRGMKNRLPQNTGLDPGRVTNPKYKGRYQALLNTELQARESGELQVAVDENRITEYIGDKEGVKDESVVDDMRSTKTVFDGGKTQSSLDQLDELFD